MSGSCYLPLIEDMRWSYTRLSAFHDCPYGWYLRYIRGFSADDRFYASFGSFMHKLIEGFYRGELTKEQMLMRYYDDFGFEVAGHRPKESTLTKYIEDGADYIRNLRPLPYNVVAVEEKIDFDVDGLPFTGVIDYLGEKDGEFYLIDNKSRRLKPRSGREKPTANDKELDRMFRQQYIYCRAVQEKYGKLPKYIGFNCFLSQEVIVEEFQQEAYEEAIQWAKDTVSEIKKESTFLPKPNAFFCFWICGVTRLCRFYHDSVIERRRGKPGAS